jgi:hypothetical protein
MSNYDSLLNCKYDIANTCNHMHKSSKSTPSGSRPGITMKIDDSIRYIIGNIYDIPISIDITKGGGLLQSIEIYVDNTLHTKIDLTDNPEYHFDIVLNNIEQNTYIRAMIFDTYGYNECSLTAEFYTPIWYGLDDNLNTTDQLLPATLVFNGRGHVVLKYPKEDNGYLTRITNDGDEYLSTYNLTEETIGNILYLAYTSKESANYNNTQLFFDNNTILEPAKIYYGINDKLSGVDDELPTTLKFSGKGILVIKYVTDYKPLSSLMNGGDNYLPTLNHSYEIINSTKYHVYISKKIAVYNNTKMELYV